MPFGLGFFATAGGAAPVAVGDYDLLTTTIVGSTAVASVTFTISSYTDYKHFQIRGVAQSDRGYSDDVYTVNLNGNALTSAHQLYGNSANVLSANESDKRVIWGAGGTVTNVFGGFVIDVLDAFSTTKNKTIRVLSGYHQSDARHIMLASGFWNNTAAITSIEIDPIYGSNFKQYSRFSLYGLKG